MKYIRQHINENFIQSYDDEDSSTYFDEMMYNHGISASVNIIIEYLKEMISDMNPVINQSKIELDKQMHYNYNTDNHSNSYLVYSSIVKNIKEELLRDISRFESLANRISNSGDPAKFISDHVEFYKFVHSYTMYASGENHSAVGGGIAGQAEIISNTDYYTLLDANRVLREDNTENIVDKIEEFYKDDIKYIDSISRSTEEIFSEDEMHKALPKDVLVYFRLWLFSYVLCNLNSSYKYLLYNYHYSVEMIENSKIMTHIIKLYSCGCKVVDYITKSIQAA